MTRAVTFLAVTLGMMVAGSVAEAAPKRAYKPAERRAQEAEAQPAQDAEPAVAATYEDELRVAKEKRDKELQDAAAAETDQRRLEKKKQEIFAQYAAIVAALRDKYEAAHPDDQTAPTTGRNRPRTKAARTKAERDEAAMDEPAPKSKKRPAKARDSGDALAEAKEKLAEENARHAAKLGQLNAQLAEAQKSDTQREVRRVQKAIEKENNSYSARKLILERRVVDLGGSVAPLPAPPTPAPANP